MRATREEPRVYTTKALFIIYNFLNSIFTSNAVVTCKVHIDLLMFLALEVITRFCLRKSTLHVCEVKPNLG